MRKTLPDAMFSDPERSRLTMLRTWVLDNAVTEIEMNERQFWNFAQLQPVAEKPWVTFMGRIIAVSDMPVAAQKHLGIFDARNPAAILINQLGIFRPHGKLVNPGPIHISADSNKLHPHRTIRPLRLVPLHSARENRRREGERLDVVDNGGFIP